MKKELDKDKWLNSKNICNARGGCLNPAKSPHSCPYASEINDNDAPDYCTCCDDCRHECAMDV